MSNMHLKFLSLAIILLTASCISLEKSKTHKSSLRKNQAHTEQSTLHTLWGGDGMKDLDELTKHYVDCKDSNQALKKFQLQKDSGQMRFEYECKSALYYDPNQCTEYSNTITQYYQSAIQIFAEQKAVCPSFNVLSAFGLKKTEDGSQLRFTYTCCVATLGFCGASGATLLDYTVTSGIPNLHAYTAWASGDSVMTGYEFKVGGSSSWRYGYYIVSTCWPKPTLYNKTTMYMSGEAGAITSLNKHNVDCRTSRYGALSYFGLRSPYTGFVDYRYGCSQVYSINYTDCYTKTTDQTALAGDLKKALPLLANHDVKCDAGTVMTQFQMKTNSASTQMWYEMSCCPAILENCTSTYTDFVDLDQGSAKNLDRIAISHENAITGFQFEASVSGSNVKGRYRVDGCLIR